MKSLKNYICNESRTADFIVAIADCVKDPKNVSNSDVKSVQAMLKKDYNMDTDEKQSKDLIELMIKDWPELFFENATDNTIDESENLVKNNETEELPNGYSIVYKHGIEKKFGDVKGLHLTKYYYAELYKDGKMVDWMYAEASAEKIFNKKIEEWKAK